MIWCQTPTLTKTCQTFSLAPSKLQKRMLSPSSPGPPHMVLGVMVVSLTASVLLLYKSILTGLSTFIFSSSFSVSLSLFCQRSKHLNSLLYHSWDYTRLIKAGPKVAESCILVIRVNLQVWCHKQKLWNQRMAPVLHGDQGNSLAPVKFSIMRTRQWTPEDWKCMTWFIEWISFLLQHANGRFKMLWFNNVGNIFLAHICPFNTTGAILKYSSPPIIQRLLP